MSGISEKVAYLNGLLDGLDLADEKLKKLFSAVVETLNCVTAELAEQEDQLADLTDTVDGLVDDLEDFEEMLLGDDDDIEFGENDDSDDDEDEDDDFFDEEDFLEVTCKNCGDIIYFDVGILDAPDGLICTNCNAPIEIEAED